MEKVKIDIPASVYDEWFEACVIGGQKIMIRKRISYTEMVEFATEYAQGCCVIDEEAQIAYEVNETKKILDYLLLKYYSNVDMDDLEDAEAYASNLMGLIDEFLFYDHTNAKAAIDMAKDFVINTINIYESYHALGTKVLNAFGGILNGGDLMKELSESRGLSEQILTLMQKSSMDSDNIVTFKQFAKKPD